MLARLPRPQVRHLHTSLVCRNLIGPSDSISNLRPVIYDDAVPEHRTDLTHPYSLREFAGDTREYQWKMQRQQLDAFNHVFWTDVSTLRTACVGLMLNANVGSVICGSMRRSRSCSTASLSHAPRSIARAHCRRSMGGGRTRRRRGSGRTVQSGGGATGRA